MEIKTGMMFALEAFCPAGGGFSAARIEEDAAVTDGGCGVTSLIPAQGLPIADKH